MTTIYDPIHGRALLPGKVIPEVFGEAISYEDKIIALLKWILKQGYVTQGQYDELVKQIETLRDEFDEFKTSGFEDYYEQLLREWINSNFAAILAEGIKSVVFFGLTLDGYFTAYIPQSWSDIIFDTDCETSPGLFSIEEIKDTLDVLRSCILAGDTISAA